MQLPALSSSLVNPSALPGPPPQMSQPLDLDAQLAELEGFAGLEELAAEAQVCRPSLPPGACSSPLAGASLH